MFHFIFHYFGYKILSFRARITVNFYITETMINKTGCPSGIFCFVSAYNIYICRTCITQIPGKEFPISLQSFREAETNTVTSLSLNAETYPTCHILAKVQNVFVTKLFDRSGFQRIHDFHSRHHLGAQCSRRNTYALGRHPVLVIVSVLCPVSQFLAGIIFFTVIFVVAANGALGSQFPRSICGNRFFAAVRIFHNQVQPKFGITECRYLVRFIILTHGIEAPIPQGNAYCVLFLKL